MCGSHLHQRRARLDLLAVLDEQHRRRWAPSTLRASRSFGPMMRISPLRRQGDALALVVGDGVDALELDGAGLLGLDLALADVAA